MSVTFLTRIKEDPVILLQLFVALMILMSLTAMVMAFAGVFGSS